MESLKEEPSGSLKKEKYRGESEERHAANRLKEVRCGESEERVLRKFETRRDTAESLKKGAANRLKKCAVEDLNEYSCEELEEMRMRA